jgi:glycine cleavage system H protein
MTVVLMLFTITLFLAADYAVQRRREQAAAAVLRNAGYQLPAEYTLAPNHLWVKKAKDGFVIGCDELIARALGAVESLVLPTVGSAHRKGETCIGLRTSGNELHIGLPFDGTISAVNDELVNNPALAGTDPYNAGWLLKISTEGSSILPSSFRHGRDAFAWLKEQGALAKDFFTANMPAPQLATLQDGGTLAPGVLRNCSPAVWSEFERRFVSIQPSKQ